MHRLSISSYLVVCLLFSVQAACGQEKGDIKQAPGATAAVQAAPTPVPAAAPARAPAMPPAVADDEDAATLVSMTVTDAKIQDVLHLLQDTRKGVKIIVGPEVQGEVSLAIRALPWSKALQAICEASGCQAMKEGNNVYRIRKKPAQPDVQPGVALPRNDDVAAGPAAAAAPAADNDAAWSPPVNGLRARLFVLAPQKPDSPFCRVLIEMQNVDDVAGQKRIRFSPDSLGLRVVDARGKELPVANEPYAGWAPTWEPTLLPQAGVIRFQISSRGLGHRPADKLIVDVGPSKAWIVPQDGPSYWLAGKMTVEQQEGDRPRTDWSGALELPKVEIPKVK